MELQIRLFVTFGLVALFSYALAAKTKLRGLKKKMEITEKTVAAFVSARLLMKIFEVHVKEDLNSWWLKC